jgi:hypothetical protein
LQKAFRMSCIEGNMKYSSVVWWTQNFLELFVNNSESDQFTISTQHLTFNCTSVINNDVLKYIQSCTFIGFMIRKQKLNNFLKVFPYTKWHAEFRLYSLLYFNLFNVVCLKRIDNLNKRLFCLTWELCLLIPLCGTPITT